MKQSLKATNRSLLYLGVLFIQEGNKNILLQKNLDKTGLFFKGVLIKQSAKKKKKIKIFI